MSVTWLLAGMPSIELTDVARMRLDSLSFFLMILLLSAAGVMLIWNSFRRDFSQIPRLSYGSALAGTVLWGLLFLFVLTMISGARELLTPGAWRKVGWTYELAASPDPDAGPPPETPDSADELFRQRQARLELLRTMLWTYAAAHQGAFPPDRAHSRIAEELWRQPGMVAVDYGYNGGMTINEESQPLVFEYAVYDDGRQLQLDTRGAIQDVAPVGETASSEAVADEALGADLAEETP